MVISLNNIIEVLKTDPVVQSNNRNVTSNIPNYPNNFQNVPVNMPSLNTQTNQFSGMPTMNPYFMTQAGMVPGYPMNGMPMYPNNSYPMMYMTNMGYMNPMMAQNCPYNNMCSMPNMQVPIQSTNPFD